MKSISSAHSQQGYILVLNIIVLALMLLGASYIGQRISQAIELAHAEQQRTENEYLLEDARARVLFMLAVTPRGKAGLGNTAQAVQLDGRPYRIGEKVLVRLQDTNGLIGINGLALGTTRRNILERLLATYGLAGGDTERLIDTLLDYRDEDDLRRINGAERDDYRTAGKAGLIRNDALLTPDETGRLLNWPETAALWNPADPLTNHIGIQKFSPFNPNTADWRALVAMTGIDEQVIKSLIERRRKGELTDIAPLLFAGDIGNPFAAGSTISQMPSTAIRVTLNIENTPWGIRFLVTHTPGASLAPWHIEYAHRIFLPPQPTDKNRPTPQTMIATLPEPGLLRDDTLPQRLQLPF